MGVAVDAKMTAGNSSDGKSQQATGVATISSTGIIVGAGATLLTVTIIWQGLTSGSVPTAITVTWNGVSMALRAFISSTSGTNGETVAIYTLVNPAAGAKTLQANWTGTMDAYMSAMSWTGTNTVTGVNTGDNTTATQTTTITVPSDANGASLAVFAANGSSPTMNFTPLFTNSTFGPGAGASYNLGGASDAHTYTGSGGDTQALAGVHIIAGAGGVAGPTISQKSSYGSDGFSMFGNTIG